MATKKEYQAKWYRKHRRQQIARVEARRKQHYQLIREAKNKPCADCGRSYPYYVMDFDHARGRKKFNLATAPIYYGIKAILKEIAKCDVVCSNCHRERSFRRSGFVAQRAEQPALNRKVAGSLPAESTN